MTYFSAVPPVTPMLNLDNGNIGGVHGFHADDVIAAIDVMGLSGYT